MSLRALTRPARLWAAFNLCPSAVVFSAYGEDRVIIGWLDVVFKINNWREVRYLDIGACYPTLLSNTYGLYRRGARGVLVEPNPDLIPELKRKRPNDVVVCAGVAFDERRSARLTRYANPAFNTFNGAQTSAAPISTIETPLIPINQICAEHLPGPLHFLSIDAEGVDLDILQTLDFEAIKPWLICIEASKGPEHVAKVLDPHGYEFIAKTPDNLLYALKAR